MYVSSGKRLEKLLFNMGKVPKIGIYFFVVHGTEFKCHIIET